MSTLEWTFIIAIGPLVVVCFIAAWGLAIDLVYELITGRMR